MYRYMSIFIYRRSGGPRAHERINCKQAALNWLERAVPYMSAVGFEPERLRRRPGKPKNTQMKARRFEIVQTQSYAECPADSAVDFLACKKHIQFYTSGVAFLCCQSRAACLGTPVSGRTSQYSRLGTRLHSPFPAARPCACHGRGAPDGRTDNTK